MLILSVIITIISFFIKNAFQKNQETLKEITDKLDKFSDKFANLNLDFTELKGKEENLVLNFDILKNELNEVKKECKENHDKILLINSKLEIVSKKHTA